MTRTYEVRRSRDFGRNESRELAANESGQHDGLEYCVGRGNGRSRGDQ